MHRVIIYHLHTSIAGKAGIFLVAFVCVRVCVFVCLSVCAAQELKNADKIM